MRLSQLRCFVTIAQLENMSQAAELLHLSQSSLSKSLASLEEELGMELFQRNGRSLSLNPAGGRFLEYCTMALRELEYAEQDMNLLISEADSRIRIGTAGYCDRLAECLADFRRRMPGTEFDVTGSIESNEHLDISEFDMLIYPDTRKYEKYTGMELYEEHYCLAVNSGHPLAGNTVVQAKDLNGLDMVFLRSGRSGEEYPWQICSALALRFSSVCYTDTRELHHRMIAGGMCAGFVPAGCSGLYRTEGISLIPVHDRRFNRRMMICFRREKYLTPAVKEFRDHVLTYFGVNRES